MFSWAGATTKIFMEFRVPQTGNSFLLTPDLPSHDWISAVMEVKEGLSSRQNIKRSVDPQPWVRQKTPKCPHQFSTAGITMTIKYVRERKGKGDGVDGREVGEKMQLYSLCTIARGGGEKQVDMRILCNHLGSW